MALVFMTLLDTRHSLETPEGAQLPITPAGFGARTLAQLIDIVIRMAINFVLFLFLSLLGKMGTGIALILTFLLEWFYPVFFELTRQGRTPGKKQMGIRVINDDGTPVTFAASLLRNLLRVVDFLPAFYLVGVVASVCNKEFKRLGDLAASTLVVYDAPKITPVDFATSGQLAVPTDFTTDEQRSLLAFAERSVRLSKERQAELAMIIQPLLQKENLLVTNPVVAIKQMANTLIGKH
jgi:uncharacterized RDD family membrane protein YckC